MLTTPESVVGTSRASVAPHSYHYVSCLPYRFVCDSLAPTRVGVLHSDYLDADYYCERLMQASRLVLQYL